MESNKLSVLDNQIPLKAYPEKDIDLILKTTFMFWLSKLLSLKSDKEEIVLDALPEIKYHFHSLGLHQVKKAFEMYARGQLITQPISNYFDIILVSKIFKEFKKQQPIKKKEIIMPEITQEEKDDIIYAGCVNCFDQWNQTKQVINGYMWVHDHLMDLKLLEFTKDEKVIMWNEAKENLLNQSKSLPYEDAKDVVRELERKNCSIREVEYKLIRMKRYFEKIHAKGKHIKEVL